MDNCFFHWSLKYIYTSEGVSWRDMTVPKDIPFRTITNCLILFTNPILNGWDHSWRAGLSPFAHRCRFTTNRTNISGVISSLRIVAPAAPGSLFAKKKKGTRLLLARIFTSLFGYHLLAARTRNDGDWLGSLYARLLSQSAQPTYSLTLHNTGQAR